MAQHVVRLCFRNIKNNSKFIFVIIVLINIINSSNCASVRNTDSKVYVVTPEPFVVSEARDFPYFLPTPVNDYKEQRIPNVDTKKKADYMSPVYSTARPEIISNGNKDNKIINSPEFPPFLPTPLPDEKNPSIAYNLQKSSNSQEMPDIIMAEFKPGSKNGKPNERMLSVKEMLSKEKIATYTTVRSIPQVISQKGVDQNMKIKDVWDIIKHNQDLETTTSKVNIDSSISLKKSINTNHYNNNNKDSSSEVLISPSIDSEYSYTQDFATVPFISKSSSLVVSNPQKILNVVPSSSNPNPKQNYKPNDQSAVGVEFIPSVSMDSKDWENQQHIDSKFRNPNSSDESRTIRGNEYSWNFPESRNPVRTNSYSGYKNYNSNYYNMAPSKYDSYGLTNTAQDRYNPAQPYLPPKPDVVMAPPKPRKPMPPPPVPMPPPPPPPQDSMPPPPTGDSKPDDISYLPGPPSDDSYKYEPPSDLDTFPQFNFDDDHHHFHDDHDFHYHHPPPTTTTTTTTPEPEKRDINRFSYYYLGRKLWYLPLYFSVYFIIYVMALIIKSIARHKITYPQHFRTRRALDGLTSDETINNLTRIMTNAVMKYGEKYYANKT